MKDACLKKVAWYILFVVIISSVVSGFTVHAGKAAIGKAELQTILRQSLKSLWRGESFSPELIQKQKNLRKTLQTGEVKKGELKEMVEQEMASVINHDTTSRYILETMPDRVNALFAPFMDWKTLKQDIIWDLISSKLTGEPFVLKLATLAPAGTPWLNVPQTILVPKIKALTNGKLQAKIYEGGVMGEDPDVLRKMDIGQLDGCGCTTLGVFKASPDASVFMVPDLFNNYKEVDYIYKKFRKRLDRSFEKRGYICGAIIDSGFLYVFSKDKIFGLEDLRKQKAITCLGQIESTLLDELGVDAVPLAMPEVVSALSTGMADIFIAPPAWALGMQAYQYVDYYIKPPFFYSPGVVVLSTNVRDKIQRHFGVSNTLVHNTQELIVLEIKLLEPEWKRRGRRYEEKSLKAFETKCGMQPVTLPPEDQRAFQEAARRVQKKLAGRAYPADLLQDVQKALEKYRKQ